MQKTITIDTYSIKISKILYLVEIILNILTNKIPKYIVVKNEELLLSFLRTLQIEIKMELLI